MVKRLARLRVPLGFLSGAVAFWLASPSRASLALGAPVAVAGELLRIWAAGHLRKSSEVTASGPYRWLAHPLYAGSTVMGIGVAIACGDVVTALLIGVYLGVTLMAAIRNEEAFLREKFGDQYDRFRRAGDVDRQRRFSLAQALANREHRAAIGLLLAMLLLAWKATYN